MLIKIKMDKIRMPKLESVKIFLVHSILVKNSYQEASKVLFTFVPNEEFGHWMTIATRSLKMWNTANTEFSFVELWFTDQNIKPLEIEEKAPNDNHDKDENDNRKKT